MGEDLVLYKDLGGKYGLVDRHCPHRRADLSYGWVESNGIRCSYHGWLIDETGRCIEQPYEDTANAKPAKDNCGIKAYPVREIAGLLFAYMGPQPVPEFPVWEPFTWDNGFRERVREGQPEDSRYWTVGRLALWPNAFYLGSHFEWRVPIDDENTLSIAWFFMRVPKGREPYVQERIPTWISPIKDTDGRWISSHVINQDIAAWVGQGRIADRTKENLRSSDVGISMMRQRFFAEMEAVAMGRDPMGVIRDPAVAKNVQLPNMMREINTEGLPLEEMTKHPLLGPRLEAFRFHKGQPPDVRRDFENAMGIGRN